MKAYPPKHQAQNNFTQPYDSPGIIVVQLDSLEIIALKGKYGRENFYTIADDQMWYHSQLVEKMDSFDIPIEYNKDDTIHIQSMDTIYTIVKDSTFNLYTYFCLDSNGLNRVNVLELLWQ